MSKSRSGPDIDLPVLEFFARQHAHDDAYTKSEREIFQFVANDIGNGRTPLEDATMLVRGHRQRWIKAKPEEMIARCYLFCADVRDALETKRAYVLLRAESVNGTASLNGVASPTCRCMAGQIVTLLPVNALEETLVEGGLRIDFRRGSFTIVAEVLGVLRKNPPRRFDWHGAELDIPPAVDSAPDKAVDE